jgi:DNA-binding transcriptional ArsR family regulator
MSKSIEFSVRDNQIANIAKALSHPARVAILRILIAKKSCICGNLVEAIPLSQSTVSQHLKELKKAGLIKGDIDGTSVCYCIDAICWQKHGKIMRAFFESHEINNPSCC